MSVEERKNLVEALRGNAEDNLAILMKPNDTSFLGSAEEVTDQEVVSAIRSVPVHY
jgi:hypothetical protein